MDDEKSSTGGLTLKISPEIAARLRQQEKDSTLKNNNKNNEKDIKDKKEDEDLPIIHIDLERLIGYKPPLDELESIQSQLLTAMWTRYKETSSSDDNNDNVSTTTTTDQKLPPPDFDTQVCELLEAGAATFGQRESSNNNASGMMRIKYPPILQSPTTGEAIETAHLWRQIIRHPTLSLPLPFVERLWNYLEVCSRNLFWKRDLSIELKTLIEEEQARLEYKEWTESKRQSKLENLYSIRETMVHQVEMTKAKLDVKEEEREVEVQETMEQHRRKMEGKGLESFGTTELTFPDEFQLLGLRDEVHEEEDDWGLGNSSDSSSDDGGDDSSDGGHSSESPSMAGVGGDDDGAGEDDGYDCDNENVKESDAGLATVNEALDTTSEQHPPLVTPSNEKLGEEKDQNTNDAQPPTTISTTTEETKSSEHGLSTPFLRRKARRESDKRQKRQKRKDAKRKAKQEQLKAFEDEIRVKHTTKEFILTQTLWEALDKKIQKVDELLESLQDEVWEAEEEEGGNNGEGNKERLEAPSFSLLDQVLAMILGATPVQPNMSPQEHYTYVQNEHKSIIKEWKEHFGRLPPPAGGSHQPEGVGDGTLQETVPPSGKDTKTPLQKRLALGITDNDDEDWDAVETWDDYVVLENNEAPPSAVAKKPTVATSDNNRKSTTPVKRPDAAGLRPGGSVKR